MPARSVVSRWLVVLALATLGLYFSLPLNLGDDALDLLPGKALEGDIRLLQRLGLVDRLLVTLTVGEAAGSDAAAREGALKASTAELGRLLAASGQFSFVLYRLPPGSEGRLVAGLFAGLPRLLDADDLRQLAARTSPEGLRAALRQTFLLLNSPGGLAMKEQLQTDPLGLTTLALEKLHSLRSEATVRLEDGFFLSADGGSTLLVAESRLPLTDARGAARIEAILDRAAAAALTPGVELHLVGSLPHTLANNRIVASDLRRLLPVASLLLILLIAFSLRDIRAVAVFGVPFLAAPPAIALTLLLHGRVGGLALGFGIVLLGIAVDFSVHLYLALTREEGRPGEILRRLARPVLCAAATTTAVFVVLLFSEVASHRQMATLALVGILLAVAFAWLLIPTIAVPAGAVARAGTGGAVPGPSPPPWRDRLALFFWVLLLGAGLISWPQLRYNGDLRVLDVPEAGVLAAEAHFVAVWGERREQAFLVVEGERDTTLNANSRVHALLRQKGIDDSHSFAPVLPGPAVQAENLAAWRQFWAARQPGFTGDFEKVTAELGFRPQAFAPFFAFLAATPAPLELEAALTGPLQPLFASLAKIEADGKLLALSTVPLSAGTMPLLEEVAAAVPGVTLLANSRWRSQVEALLRHDIVTLCAAAGLAMALLVGLFFRSLAAIVAVLAPVLAALAAMALFCLSQGSELNTMHLLMAIMVIGLSVDYGIFVVCAGLARSRGSSARAVAICAASSLLGFGVLAFAVHPALHALGVTVLVGIGVAWPTALWVSPALLRLSARGA
jgi:uncharacterized protein